MAFPPRWFPRTTLVTLLLLAAACAGQKADLKSGVFRDYLVASANPAATRAGAGILAQGGTAADAAVAVEAVLGLVEPQSSGLGGGGFLIYYDAKTRKLTSYDGRETAPAATKPDQFLGPDGNPKPTLDQVVGGKSVGAPGVVPMLALAHRAHGQKAWRDLLVPAIDLAENGFTVAPRMSRAIGLMPTLKSQPDARAYLFDAGGQPLAFGTRVRNPDYAQTLRAISENPNALHEGPIARAIMSAVAHAPQNPQQMTLADLGGYQPRERAPVCAPYRALRVCGMGPPSSGGIAVLQVLGMIERFDLAELGPNDPQSWHLIAEAERLALADRALYVADPDFVSVPVTGLLDPGYIEARSRLIDPERGFQGEREAGTPAMTETQAWAPGEPLELASTTHFSIVDRYGNVAAMTASIEAPFGSQQMAAGFFLNNELTDFSPRPMVNGKPVANAAAAGKRPMSSMSPMIVFDGSGRAIMAIGSPGGRRIIGYVVKTLVGVLDWKLSMQAAIDLPNVLNLNGPTEIEGGPAAAALATALEAKGHKTKIMSGEASGLHGFHVTPAGYEGGADRRRDGTVEGGRPASSAGGLLRLFQ
jgi:gamma-glutamyltranspeptidase/glutathione hydrolase